jgi:hypothetical protein
MEEDLVGLTTDLDHVERGKVLALPGLEPRLLTVKPVVSG